MHIGIYEGRTGLNTDKSIAVTDSLLIYLIWPLVIAYQPVKDTCGAKTVYVISYYIQPETYAFSTSRVRRRSDSIESNPAVLSTDNAPSLLSLRRQGDS